MRHFFMFLALVVCGAGLYAADPERITSFAKNEIEVDLERLSKAPAQCQVRFRNRSTSSVKVLYRVQPTHGEARMLSVVLRSNREGDLPEWREPVVVPLPSGDYSDIELRSVTPGYVRERTGTRVSSNGTSEDYAELEFTSQDDVVLIQREQLQAQEVLERRRHSEHHPAPHPVAPVVTQPQTWEEKRDQELKNERKVWKNP